MNRCSMRRKTGSAAGARAGCAGLVLLAALAGACGRGDDGRKHAMAAGGGSAPAEGEAALIARTLQVSSDSGALLRAGGDTLHVGPSATTFYKGRGWAPAWTSDGKVTAEGKALLA